MKYNACILIAQNDPFFFLNCKNFFSQYNILVVSVENNYQKILHKINILKPDVVLLEAMVPPFDSIAIINATRFLRFNNSKVPIFFVLSCINDSKLKWANLKAGAREYILKPVDNYFVLSRIFNTIISSNSGENSIDEFYYYRTAKNKSHIFENLEYLIAEVLAEFKIPVKMKGYDYLYKAINYSVLNISSDMSITKQIYPMIAKSVNSNIACVERSIRHVIKVAWQGELNSSMIKYFSYKRPTNLQFIELVSKQLIFRNQNCQEVS